MPLAQVLLLLLVLIFPAAGWAEDRVLLLELQGVIGPASKDFVLRGLEQATQSGAKLLILRMNTPGGLDSSMRDIIQAILSSKIPVATYVAPSGARAASAGTYILYASHIAAMAPATNLGAATPVQIGGVPGIPSGESPDEGKSKGKEAGDQAKDNQQPQQAQPALDKAPKSAMERKIVNDARAYIRSLAQLRGRNVDWAEQAVQDAASLSSEDAQARGVIDFVATSVTDLIRKVQGRAVEVNGAKQILTLTDPVVETIAPDWRNRLLAIITDPQVAYILMLIGVYGLFFELANPGAVAPGVLGGICLLLALFAFQVLPVNYAGLGLIALGLAFMIAEAFLPSFGALGLGGVVAFVVGSVILWDERIAGYDIPLSLILGFALASGVLFIGLGTLALRNRRRRGVSGDARLLGTTAVVLEDFDGEGGWVRVLGEAWRATAEQPLKKGEPVRIVKRTGLQLFVRPAALGDRRG